MKENELQAIENSEHSAFKVGDWIVVPERSILVSTDGNVVEIEMMAIELLKYLASHQNSVLSVDTLMDNVWAGKIVTQGTIRRIVSILRKALCDDTKHPTYIQNITKRGYVLIAPVEFNVDYAFNYAKTPEKAIKNQREAIQPHPMRESGANDSELRTDALSENTEERKVKHSKKPHYFFLLGFLCIFGIVLVYFSGVFTDNSHVNVAPIQAVSMKGSELHPELDSVNGRLLFSHFSPDNQYWHLYSSDLTTSTLRQLTSGATINMLPKLSRDARKLAYVRFKAGKFQVVTADYSDVLSNEIVQYESDTSISSIEWVNDSNELFIAARDERNIYSIYSLDITDRELTRITHPPGGSKGDYLSSLSPSGQYLAVARLTSSLSELIIYNLNNMTPINVLKASSVVPSIDWNLSQLLYLDGKKIIAVDSENRWETSELYVHEKSLSGISAQDNQLFMTVGDLSNSELRQVPNPFTEEGATPSNLRISSNFPDYFGEYSRTNTNVYFVSQRSGMTQVWMQSEEFGIKEITSFDSAIQISRLAADFRTNNIAGVAEERLFTADTTSSDVTAHFHTSSEQRVSHPNWANDGSKIYFILHTIDDQELWQLNLSDGTTSKIMKNIDRALTSKTSDFLYVLRENKVMTLDPNTLALSSPIFELDLDHNEDWQLINENLYWSTVSIDGTKLSRFNLIDRSEQHSDFFNTGDTGRFSVSADETSILMTFFYPDQTDIFKVQLP